MTAKNLQNFQRKRRWRRFYATPRIQNLLNVRDDIPQFNQLQFGNRLSNIPRRNQQEMNQRRYQNLFYLNRRRNNLNRLNNNRNNLNTDFIINQNYYSY